MTVSKLRPRPNMRPLRTAARLIYRGYAVQPIKAPELELSYDDLQTLLINADTELRIARKAAAVNCPLASKVRIANAVEQLKLLQARVSCTIHRLSPDYEELMIPTQALILEELQAIAEEWGDIKFDFPVGKLSVVTDPITLSDDEVDVSLGAFRLEIHWKPTCGNRLRAVALNPNPADGDETVTHPHVRKQAICLGEAAVAVQLALDEGRLGDVLSMANAVLSNYNDESPYVPLHAWYGSDDDSVGVCSQCGSRFDSEDEGSCCRACEEYACGSCTTLCNECERQFCSSCCANRCYICKESWSCRRCKTKCASCEQVCCGGCRASCADCNEITCTVCLESVDGDDLCPECRGKCKDCEDFCRTEDLNENGICDACQENLEEADKAQETEPVAGSEIEEVVNPAASIADGVAAELD